jgi:hypothetical protein
MRILTITLMLALSNTAIAQENQDSPRRQVDTNVIGTQEAPSVLNVVPWKDKAVKLEKRDPTSFLRDRVLEPLDRDVLMREVEYYRMLNQKNDEDSLFLE